MTAVLMRLRATISEYLHCVPPKAYLGPGPSHPHLYVTTTPLLRPRKAGIIISNINMFLLNNERTDESLRAIIPSFQKREHFTKFSLRYSTVQFLQQGLLQESQENKTQCPI